MSHGLLRFSPLQLDLDSLDEVEEGTVEELPSVPSRPVKGPEEEEELPSVPRQPVAAKQKRRERGMGRGEGVGVVCKRDVGVGGWWREWGDKKLTPELDRCKLFRSLIFKVFSLLAFVGVCCCFTRHVWK